MNLLKRKRNSNKQKNQTVICKKLLILLVLSCLQIFHPAFGSESKAQELFNKLNSSIVQIQIIEIESGNKSSIGSGFIIHPDNQVISNYHVVAEAIRFPDKYNIRFLNSKNQTGDLHLVDLDVVHDLAVLTLDESEASKSVGSGISMVQDSMLKGASLYAIGNPRDLGMTVVLGSYGGLLETSMYHKILFSGSLNPGMSGGPAVNEEGQLVGVNVATAGNQISFLVPTEYLVALLNRADKELGQVNKKPLLKKRLHKQLLENQQVLTDSLLSSHWPVEEFGQAKVPGEATAYIKCWGGTARVEKALFEQTHKECFSQDQIYINEGLTTGQVSYSFSWYRTDKVGAFRFYNQYEQAFKGIEVGNRVNEEHVTDFTCHTDFLNRDGSVWRSVLCARAYKDFKGLFDITFVMASLFEPTQGLIADFTVAGVEKENGMKLLKTYLEQVQWKP